MREIHLTNSQKVDAKLGFVAKPTHKKTKQVLKNGDDKDNNLILRSTIETSIKALTKKYGEDLSEHLINGDPEIDIEKVGIKLSNLNRIYVDKDDNILFRVKRMEISKNVEGEEVSRKIYESKLSNINLDIPIKWSNKFMPKKLAIKKFVFSKHYQIHHVNGLTFDFLYNMAKELDEKNALMYIGTGKKGKNKLIMTTGGIEYSGFLEGRVKGESYLLILHLTNLQLKELVEKEE